MADSRRDVNRPDVAQPPRRHGLLYNLLWGGAVGTGRDGALLPVAEPAD